MGKRKRYAPIPLEAERFGKALLDAAFEVHTILGPGFLERVYEDALCYELTFYPSGPTHVLSQDDRIAVGLSYQLQCHSDFNVTRLKDGIHRIVL